MHKLELNDEIVENMMLTSALKYRTIYLYSDVTDDLCFKVNYFLDRLIAMDKKKGTKEPVTIIVKSYGGSLYDILSTISRVDKMIDDGYEIISIIDGYAMSAGSALSMVATKRYARRYSSVLFHQLSSGIAGTLAEMETQQAENRRLWAVMKELMKKYTTMDDDFIDSIYTGNKDVYFTVEDCLKYGIADEIL